MSEDAEYMKRRKAMVGRKFPIPGGPKQQGPNMLPRAPAETASAPSKGVNFLNPRAVNAKREKEAGMACGGKVKRYASGGKVRGCGVAMKGKTKGVMR
jgi:hypothetical protein